ncbi:MAG: EAL domain-containing protein [Methylovulum sp.]|nr:EAL domain-containing protein [Methylovulum sp.]
MIRLNILFGIAYVLGGYLGTLLALPPSHASPIWPAAGIAFAGFVVYGRRVLPGIWLGAFLLQSYAFLDASNLKTLTYSLTIGVITSVAATAQAVFGAWLVKRYAGADHDLIHDVSILRFLGLGGPVSCTVSASVGILTLYLGGVSRQDDMLFGWLTWWSGDTIGVLVFTPLLLCFIGKPRPQWRTRINSIGLPLMVLLTMVAALFYLGKKQEQKRIGALFEERTSLLHNALQNEFNRTVDVNRTLKAFFDSSLEISPAEFKVFTHTLFSGHKNIQALEWIPRVTDKNLLLYQQRLGPNFIIQAPDAEQNMQPVPAHGEYFPITYVEPYSGNERAFGFDISSNPAARKTIERARDSGQTTVSGRLHLIQDPYDYPGVVFYTPIYRPHQPVDTEAQRKQYLQGFVASVLLVGQKVNEVKRQFENLQLVLTIIDGDVELFNDAVVNSTLTLDLPKQQKNLALHVADRDWIITYGVTPQFYKAGLSWSTWWLVSGSSLFVSLFCLGLLMLTGRTLQTEGIVKLRTAELEQEIAERKTVIRRRNNHNKVLQAIVSTEPLINVLNLIVHIAEHMYPGSLCSILLLDKNGRQLRLGAAPSLPEFYNLAIDGAVIGDGAGSCGTAAYQGRRVIVEDIKHHPYWHDFADLAARAELASCWAEPIFSSKEEVLGTFAIYHRTPYCPSEAMLDELKDLAQLASIAIEKKSSEEQIIHLAFFDALTNLPNRRLFLDRLEDALAKTLVSQFGIALLFLDLDHFKTLNDALGHDIGDELLMQVASRLKECVCAEDTVARLGGDEFVLLLVNRGAIGNLSEHASAVAGRVQAMLLQAFDLKGYVHHISSSIGITLLEQTQATAQAITSGQLLKQADTAMYHAKQRGRNAISFYHEDMQRRADQRLVLEQDLRIALSAGQFLLHYQPQFDDNRRLIGAEALLRWRHPDKGMVSPADFIPVAEESGLILSIGDWVLRTACQQLQHWPKLPHLAVNICPREFHQTQFEEKVIAILNSHDISATQLMLEITEGIIIDDVGGSIAKLQALNKHGVAISIDDFGTGYSSLSYLKMLPIKQLKIDQSFIRDICVDPNDAVIVESIIVLAGQLGLSVIAEGVETAGQLQFLNEKHCKGYQGYFFSRPLPEEEFTRLYM